MSWFILGTCLEIIGWGAVMDAFGVPYICQGDPSCGTTSMSGDAVELPAHPGNCYLEVRPQDPYFDFLWNQPVMVDGVQMTTPGLAQMTQRASAPYMYRAYWGELDCPFFFEMYGWCTPNVCTAQDKLAGDCTCTAAEQANNECTP